MRHADHVALLRDGVVPGVWADLGSGDGAFTLALADLLGGSGRIHSVDRDARALRDQARAMATRLLTAPIEYVNADFTETLDLPPLDGILMANSLHFVRNKADVLGGLLAHLKPAGRFVLVEYDADRGNAWVPYPLSYAAWAELAPAVGLVGTRLLRRVPSRVLGAMYAAASDRQPPLG